MATKNASNFVKLEMTHFLNQIRDVMTLQILTSVSPTTVDAMQLQHARTLSEVGRVRALQDTRLQTTVSHVVCECHRYCKCQFGTTCNSSFLHSWRQSENNSLGLVIPIIE